MKHFGLTCFFFRPGGDGPVNHRAVYERCQGLTVWLNLDKSVLAFGNSLRLIRLQDRGSNPGFHHEHKLIGRSVEKAGSNRFSGKWGDEPGLALRFRGIGAGSQAKSTGWVLDILKNQKRRDSDPDQFSRYGLKHGIDPAFGFFIGDRETQKNLGNRALRNI